MNYLTPAQCRAARGLLDWSQPELAEKCGMHVQTICAFENETGTPTKSTLEKILGAFDLAGIGIGENESVFKTENKIRTLRGRDGFLEFFKDVYAEIERSKSTSVYVSNVDECDFIRLQSDEFVASHIKKLLSLKAKYKILVKEGDNFFPAEPYAEYRWIPEDIFFSVPFYVYGTKVAIIIFENKDVRVYILNEPEISKLHRKQFEALWAQSTKPTKNK